MKTHLRTVLPLLAAYLLLVALYVWQAWRRETPTLFSDEIEFTQLSRSIAETGKAALRGGEPARTRRSTPTWPLRPGGWTASARATWRVKTIGVLVMTAAIFPAYWLARLVVTWPYALFAAVATAAAPALSYSPFLVEEPMAYPAAALALFLIARAGIAGTRRSTGVAVLACIGAALVRSQLAVLLRRPRRSSCSLESGAASGCDVGAQHGLQGTGRARQSSESAVRSSSSALLSRRSYSWYLATSAFKDRMLEYGLWAAGALAIGIGVLPVIAALAALVRPRDEARTIERDTFVALTIAAIVAFGLYTAVKAAVLSTTLAIVVAERNLIYLCPLLFTGTALLLERRRASAARSRRPLPSCSISSRRRRTRSRSTPTTRRTGWRSPLSRTGSSAGARSRSRRRSS